MKKNKPTVIGEFTGKCADIVLNNNQMTLPRELFEYLFASEEYKRAMKYRHYIGFLGHPEDPNCMDYEHACIVMTNCYIDDNGEVHGTFDLIDTPVGRVVKAFIDAGVTFGISIRGAGDIAADGTVDPETFVFRGFDLVTFPAYDDAIPTFKEIAASSDINQQVKYKKVCVTLNKNLQDIKSCEALDIIQAQFNPDSEEYEAVEHRKDELQDEGIVEDELDDITAAQLEGMTQLYLAQVEANKQLNEENRSLSVQLRQTRVKAAKKIKSLRRITSSQISNLSNELDSVSASYRTSVAANTRLKTELQATKDQNLKYVHKIEANSQTICQKDSTISDLRSELSETVTASTASERRASNLDDTVRNLKARVEAAEQMVFDYQQAYANMYANALGVCLENLPISASTSVQELQKMICGGTSTSNIAALQADELSNVDFIEDENIVDGDNELTCL